MQVVNGKEERIVKALRDYGLCEYEARMYFTMLTIGEAKAGVITRKASVPNSKTYEILDDLIAKGFAELSSAERPKEYRATNLRKITERAKRKKRKEIRDLEKKYNHLQKLLEQLIPIHSVHSGPNVRLFTPRYTRR